MASGDVIMRLVVASVLSTVFLAMIGCSTEEERSALRHAEAVAAGDVADDALFRVDVQLFYRTAGTRWRLSEQRVFPIRDESSIKAEVTLHNIRPQRTYSCHLVWIRPDGREMFRRYAEVIRHEVALPEGVAPDTSEALPRSILDQWSKAYGAEVAEELATLLTADPQGAVAINEIVYKKAIDLAFAQRRVAVAEEPSATLDSRLNISRERRRAVGLYHLRVYLDRRLLHEIPFHIED